MKLTKVQRMLFFFFLVRSIIVPKCHRNSFEEEEMQTETGEEG